MRITFVLWRGDIGGAERVTAALAAQLRRMSVDANVLFACGPGRLATQLAVEEIPYDDLALPRGATVVLHPLRLRAALSTLRPDVVIAVAVGYLGAAIRAAGFRGPIIGIEHGQLIRTPGKGRVRLLKDGLDRRIGVGAYDAEVAISRFMSELIDSSPHARRVAFIPHGVAAPNNQPAPAGVGGDAVVVGFAGRLHPGKGVDRLIGALSLLDHQVVARIAGDGPMRQEWEDLARRCGVADRVRFLGWTDDVHAHWVASDIAVAPNDGCIESFGMSVLEAMASGRPTIVTDRGALPELVNPGITGSVAAAGDERALADALVGYVSDRQKIRAHGAAARARALADYSMVQSAERYVALAEELLGARGRRRTSSS